MILIPVKNLAHAKQRLSPLLTEGQRSALAFAMLQDVLDALAGIPARRAVTLVSGDEKVRELAAKYSYGTIDDDENAGETAAIEAATRVAMERGAEWTLVIPGDAPLVRGEEVTQILSAAPARGAVLVTDYLRRGSNAVLRRPADLFPLKFGDYSFTPHLRAAKASGGDVVQLHLPGIALDIDRPDDVARLLATPGDTRAHRLLRAWNIDAACAAAGRAPSPPPAAGGES